MYRDLLKSYILHRPTKIHFFQKARNFRSFIGYIGDTESKNALSFAELALVFNKIFSLGPIFHGILVRGPIFQGTKIFVTVQIAQ